MKQSYKSNHLKCLKCGDIMEAPLVDRKMLSCKCKNRAWIQKRPDGMFWAYGSVDPMMHERVKILYEKEKE